MSFSYFLCSSCESSDDSEGEDSSFWEQEDQNNNNKKEESLNNNIDNTNSNINNSNNICNNSNIINNIKDIYIHDIKQNSNISNNFSHSIYNNNNNIDNKNCIDVYKKKVEYIYNKKRQENREIKCATRFSSSFWSEIFGIFFCKKNAVSVTEIRKRLQMGIKTDKKYISKISKNFSFFSGEKIGEFLRKIQQKEYKENEGKKNVCDNINNININMCNNENINNNLNVNVCGNNICNNNDISGSNTNNNINNNNNVNKNNINNENNLNNNINSSYTPNNQNSNKIINTINTSKNYQNMNIYSYSSLSKKLKKKNFIYLYNLYGVCENVDEINKLLLRSRHKLSSNLRDIILILKGNKKFYEIEIKQFLREIQKNKEKKKNYYYQNFMSFNKNNVDKVYEELKSYEIHDKSEKIGGFISLFTTIFIDNIPYIYKINI